MSLPEQIAKLVQSIANPTPQSNAILAGLRLFGEQMVETMTAVMKAFDAWDPRNNRAAIEALAHAGWFIEEDLPAHALPVLGEALAKGRVAEVDEFFCDYFEDKLDERERALAAEFPRRAPALAQAFAAHRRVEFYLSVPVFVAQSEGIFFELTGNELFSENHRKKIRERLVVLNTSTAALIEPIALERLPLVMHRGQRKQLPSGALNRPAVAHGEDVEYGTRLNSCRALSLLAWASLGRELGRKTP